jgi:hypothetical protein
MTLKLSDRFMQMMSPNGEPSFGTEVLGISQDSLENEVKKTKSSGWDIEDAIKQGIDIRGKLKKKTVDMVIFLYVAKAMLAEDMKKDESKYKMSFSDFCEKIGMTEQTANRWIREWNNPEGAAASKEKGKATKEEGIIKKNASQTVEQMGVSILKEDEDYIEIEINYLGKMFYKKLKR